jgi:hypothetical protein
MTESELLLRNLDQAYDAPAWHGTNLRGALRGLAIEELVFRPQPARHNLWELAVHCAYWKYAVRRRLTGEKRGSFPLRGSNFFPRPSAGDPAATAAAWKRDLALLDDCHAALRAVVATLPERKLAAKVKGSRFTHRDTILGIAAHDLYHAGQIQLLKRLARASG